MFRLSLVLILLGLTQLGSTETIRQTKGDFYDAFRQLDEALPAPNDYRTASGAPGPAYWQQRADHKIEVNLDEKNRRISGAETITYSNNSPDTLKYLWVQLDQNRFKDHSLDRRSRSIRSSQSDSDSLSFEELGRRYTHEDTSHGIDIQTVTSNGSDLPYTIVDTMMRIDLPQPLGSGEQFSFSVEWSFYLTDQSRVDGRSGYEHFAESDTYIYLAAQWFPRMAAYTDYDGWVNRSFLGRGEFTLEFGSYEVSITVPDDHIVSATGVLQNPQDVLTSQQRRRLESARSAKTPMAIVTAEEALRNEANKSKGTKTWMFKADNVRDFAWASSRKFIWDAMGYQQEDEANPEVMAMSFYPNEAEPLWSKYSTHAIVHSMDVYSRFAFPYSFPTAQSVNAWDDGGMEYPMITFNGFRPTPYESDDKNAPAKTYSRATKYELIGVIIHEIGHMYFPMTVNSDERQWAWMDEGPNTFLEYTAALEWEENFPFWEGGINALDAMADYMASDDQVPIMTQADSLPRAYPNIYNKTTGALVVLRETVMGRDAFDTAFKEYAQRWKFKRPTPADFFRTMEDVSGIDLDWYWRGWFYSTDHVDVAIADVREYQVSTLDPEVEFPLKREKFEEEFPKPLTQIRNRADGRQTYLERHPELADFYNENDEFTVTNKDRNAYSKQLAGLEDWERASLERAIKDGRYVYFVDFENLGGLISPLPLRLTYSNGDHEFVMLPAETWRKSPNKLTKLLIRDKQVNSFELDPRHETADTNFDNNHFPTKIKRGRIELEQDSDDDRDMMADDLEK